MFEKNLTDLVRGIRNNKKNEAKYISQCIQEIKEELKQDMQKKTVAIQKLTYLQMLGYDMSWASFNVIEVMSQQRFTSKRIGYLAASQSFHEGTEVVMLATNLLKKDFTSNNQYEAGTAINALSNICTPDLARDLASDIVTLMSSSKGYVRKKAVLVMYKIFLKFPDSLRPSFPKLKDKLDDSEQAVISSAVNVICELARKNPKGYLSLAPALFKLLTSNYNNWMLIKIIKLFGALTPYEPRLAKKLVEPLSNLINTTPAMSLIYECIQTCTIGMGEHLNVIKLCISKLSSFVEDPDQNLKYLGLLALNNIMKIHPKAVAEHRDLILSCLDDEDVTIRMRALDLLTGMVTKRNLPEIVRKLLEHMERAEGIYRDELVNKIILICSQNAYAYITDFEWYITVLVQLTHVHGTTHGSLIASQVLDVVIRVKVVRRFGVKQMCAVIRDSRLLSNPEANGVCEVLYAAAWIIGEFAKFVDAPVETVDALLHPRAAVLPAHIQSIYMHSVLKLFSYFVAAAYGHLAEEEEEEDEEAFEPADIQPETVTEASDMITSRLPQFTQSNHLEVQERACFVLEVLRLYNSVKDQDDGEISAELAALFEEPLNPVAKGAIKKVPIPEDLDLDTPLNDEPPEEPDDDEDDSVFGRGDEDEEIEDNGSSRGGRHDVLEDEDLDDPWAETEKKGGKKSAAASSAEPARRSQRPNSEYYLGTTRQPKLSLNDDAPNIPVAALPSSSLGPLVVGSPAYAGAQGGKRGAPPPRKTKAYTVMTTEELPEGATREDERRKDKAPRKSSSAADALAEISLDAPLGAHEILPVARHRTDIQREQKEKEAAAAAADKQRARRGERPERGERGGEPGARRTRPPGAEGGARPHRPSRSRQTEGQLIDIGGDDSGAPATTSPAPPKGVANLLDDAEDYQEVSSPAMEAERPGRPARRPRPEGERKRRPEGERPRRPREGAEAGERGARPSAGGRRPPRGEAKEPAAAAATPASPSGSVKPKLRPLFDGEDMRAAYDARASATEKGRVTVFLVLENKSDTDITQAEVNFTDTMTVRLVRTAAGAPSAIGDIAGRMRVQHQLALTVSSVSIAQKLKGVISYEYLGDTRKIEVLLPLPVSAFVANVPLSKEQFADTLAKELQDSNLSSARVKIMGDFKSTVSAIIACVHAEAVQVSANVASAYGRSALGHHVAMLIKERAADGVVSVDIKCGDAGLGNALVQELNVLR